MIANPAARHGLTAAGAIAINLVLFAIIQWLVVDRQMRLTETDRFDLANFIRMQEQSREVQSRRDPKAPEKPKAEANRDLARLARASQAAGIGGLDVSMPDIEIEVDAGGGIQLARELTPLVRVPADYPHSALMNGTEGYVTLRFTVTETGSVADPEVIAAHPEGVFERAALRAVLRWKYQPQLSGGKPISVVSRARIKFEMAEEQ